jgi:hypothetical protein
LYCCVVVCSILTYCVLFVVLCSAPLYCILLCYTMFCCSVFCFIALCSDILYFAWLLYIVFCSVVFCVRFVFCCSGFFLLYCVLFYYCIFCYYMCCSVISRLIYFKRISNQLENVTIITMKLLFSLRIQLLFLRLVNEENNINPYIILLLSTGITLLWSVRMFHDLSLY